MHESLWFMSTEVRPPRLRVRQQQSAITELL